jgi:hypothetical protein
MMIVFLCPLGLFSILNYWNAVTKSQSWPLVKKIIALVVTTAGTFAACILAFTLLVKPWSTQGIPNADIDPLEAFLGMFFVSF